MHGLAESLALVFGLLGLSWLVARQWGPARMMRRHLRIVESAPLGRSGHLTLARVGERCFLLAVTASGVSVVTEFKAGELAVTAESARRSLPSLLKGKWVKSSSGAA